MFRHDYGLAENTLAFLSPLTLLILAVTSLAVRYVTAPISCWLPSQMTGYQSLYIHQVCFQQSWIYSTTREFIEKEDEGFMQNASQYTYHQWVPFILGLFALLCLLPHVVWRTLCGFLWCDTHALAQSITDNQRQNAAGRHVMLRDSALLLQAGLKGGNWMLWAAALLRKVLALATCVALPVLVVALFDPPLTAADHKEVSNRTTLDHGEGTSINDSLPLPEHFYCDVSIPQLQNTYRYSLICTLPLAQVYSKGFTYLYYFFVLLAVCCGLDLLAFFCRMVIPGLRDTHLQRYLAVLVSDHNPQTSHLISRFLDTLGVDGHLLLAVVEDACGPLAASDLTGHLWSAFNGAARPGQASAPPPPTVPPGHALPTAMPPHSFSSAYPSLPTGGAPSTVGGPGGDGGAAMPLLPVSGYQGGPAYPVKRA